MHALRREFFNTPLSIHFRHPTIHIMVLFVEEKESIARQLKRGRETHAHNEEVRRTGVGQLREDRPTDHDEVLARRRYQAFKEQTWDALQSLEEIFHYHFVNAQGPFEKVEQNILQEVQYQSTLELDPRTVERLLGVPVASEIIVHARQELVKRLDSYELESRELFAKVIVFIERKMMPIVLRHAISGVAHINTEDAVLDDPLALAMLIDVFSERGYHAVVDIHRIDVPEHFRGRDRRDQMQHQEGLPDPDPVPGIGDPAGLKRPPAQLGARQHGVSTTTRATRPHARRLSAALFLGLEICGRAIRPDCVSYRCPPRVPPVAPPRAAPPRPPPKGGYSFGWRMRRMKTFPWILVLTFASSAFAQPTATEIRVTGEHPMAKIDTPDSAKQLALVDAERKMLLEAVARLQDLPEVKALHLKPNQLDAYAAAILTSRSNRREPLRPRAGPSTRWMCSCAWMPARRSDAWADSAKTRTRPAR